MLLAKPDKILPFSERQN